MNRRRIFIDRAIGESRGVVTIDGRPERLIIVREGQPSAQELGARVVARVRSVERALGLAFIDLGAGPDGILNLKPEMGKIVEGGWVEVDVRAEARRGKGATLRWLAAGEGPGRLLAPGPSLDERLGDFAKGAPVEAGALARSMADQAQEETLEATFPLPGGGAITVEPTRALTAIDVDLGGRGGESAKRTARAANLAALAESARVLRLKGLGGLVVIDLAGRGHDGPELLAAARGAFAPDQPGVAFERISRFGALELTIPRRLRPALEALTDEAGEASATGSAMALLRALEREGEADRGGHYEAVAAPAIVEVAAPLAPKLAEKLGARFSLRADPRRHGFEVRRL